MAWQTPKTNWSAADGVRDSDFNRIEGNILALYDMDGLRSDVVVYVSTSGSDTSGNGTPSSPYATIGKALSVIPRNLNGMSAMISISSGTYNEAVSIVGFDGPITITGASGGTVTVSSFRVSGCNCGLENITIQSNSSVFVTNGAKLTGGGSLRTTGSSITVNYGSTLRLNTVSCSGVLDYPIKVSGCSRFFANTIQGANNRSGILSEEGSIVAYAANTLTASGAALVTIAGGRIYANAQQSIPTY